MWSPTRPHSGRHSEWGTEWPQSECQPTPCTEKTIFPFPFTLNGIWFRTKWNSIWFKIESKLSPRSYPIQWESKYKHSFLCVAIRLWSFMFLRCNKFLYNLFFPFLKPFCFYFQHLFSLLFVDFFSSICIRILFPLQFFWRLN